MAFQTLLVLLLENTASSQCPQGLAREAQTDVVEQRRNGEGRKEKEGREARRRKGRQEGKMKEKKKNGKERKKSQLILSNIQVQGCKDSSRAPALPPARPGGHLGATAASLQPAASALCPSTSVSFLLMASR